MPEQTLQVRLEAADHRPGQFTLTFNSSQYPVTLNPAANVTFSDWLRRLYPVLMGKNDPAKELAPQALLRHVGTWLWQALLPDGAPAQERDMLAQALRTGRTPLLLMLPGALAGLPWELLCDPQQLAEQGFLARRRPLMRFHPSDTPADTPVPSLPLPLRVFLLISSPPGLGENTRVDVESERAAIEQATHKAREDGQLYLRVEDIVTLQRVQDALIDFQPHIVHYIGHGEYKEQRGGLLLWEDERGNELPITDEQLAEILCLRNLHAVVLHACQTGKSNARTDGLSLAETLAHKGLPAILAQQADFSYESSQLASKAWYTALTAGQSFVEALLKVRQTLIEADRPDWAVPILQGDIASLTPMLAATSVLGPADPLLTSRGAATDLSTLTDSFVGRHRELRALCLMLESTPGSGPVLALITGPGGMGKSTLAAQAVTRYGRTYKAALTLSCEGYQGVDLFLKRIGEFLKRLEAPSFLEQTLPDPKLSTEAKIEEAIVALNGVGSLLLVIDNLDSVQNDDHTISDKDLLHLLQKLLTDLCGGRVLITGRYAVKELLAPGNFAANLLHLNLEDLSPYETNQLLLRHPALVRLSEVVREMLVREFGGLPYVYNLLNSKAAIEDVEQIIYEVRNYGTVKQKTITEERKQHTAEEWQKVHHEVVEFTTLKVIINHLSGASRTLLAQLGVLHQSFPLAAIEQGVGVVRAAWQPLLDWSLLHYDPLEQTYRLHSITRRYAEDLLDEPARTQAQAQLAAWYEQYADRESHELTDYLEARRLWRAAGNVQQAGELVMHIAEVLSRFGLYPLLHGLCTITLRDIPESDEQLVAQTLYVLGTIAQKQGGYPEAVRLYQRSLEIKERLGDQHGRATSLLGLGNIAFLQGGYPEAMRLYGQSLKIYERLGDQHGRASTLLNLGNIALLQGDYPKARRRYQQSLKIAERLGNQNEQASTLQQLGMLAQKQGDYPEAMRLYGQSLKIYERLGDQGGQADILYHLGNIAQEQGGYPEAVLLYQQSLEIAERLGDQGGQASTLLSLGMLAQKQGNYPEAVMLYQQSLEICERLGDQQGRANTLYQLGEIAFFQRNWQEARRLCEQSLEICERLGDQQGRANTLHSMGDIALVQGGYPEAMRLYQQSLEIKERLGDQRGQAIALHSMGMMAHERKDYQEAVRLYGQSLEIKERLGDQHGRASTLGQLGLLAYQQRDFEHALTYTMQAYILFDSLHSPDRDIAQHMIVGIRSNMDEATFTAHWRTIAGDRPLPILPDEETNQQLIQVVIDFIQAPTWGEKKRFLESHLEFLQPEVDTVLQTFAAQQEHDDVRKTIEEHRLLLADCRDKGIDAAFAAFQVPQRPKMTFAAELNRICNEVVITLRAANAVQQEILATHLEKLLKEDLPMVGALDFLRVLVALLREQDTQTLEQKLQPPFRDLYAQMVAAVEHEEAENTDKGQTVEKLPGVVSSVILQGTMEERQQFATALIENQQYLPPEGAALGRFFACLAAALLGETPEVAELEAPFTDLWQAFQDTLRAPGEESQQGESKHG